MSNGLAFALDRFSAEYERAFAASQPTRRRRDDDGYSFASRQPALG